MTLLEQTIIAIAAQRLTEAKDSDREASRKSLEGLFTLVEIAHVKGSGMSDSAVAELFKMEREAIDLAYT